MIVDTCNQACWAEVRKGGGKCLLVFSRVHYHLLLPFLTPLTRDSLLSEDCYSNRCGLALQIACEQALLYERAKQVSRERPNRRACSQATLQRSPTLLLN